MLVVLANDLPPAVRGRMKLWFVEPKPNVFVSGVKDSVAKTVTEYLLSHCSVESGLVIFRQTPHIPYYEIQTLGKTKKELIKISGLQLVIEKNLD
ncbi:CRISPR-associated protein Cas2 [Chelonobacter oris]|uniref:CRISPR-associated protein Cas2 n=1 Tax=Chelonobacter oris TaxID=505317 RepID=A0A0A3AL01_9PAST|nr:type I-E CRISPR-associated endoribonuclease Cas2e [Chelonobacter oris]KGQ70073.1 CRISPR-associated protein Cas2 [Chelonobacter oris]